MYFVIKIAMKNTGIALLFLLLSAVMTGRAGNVRFAEWFENRTLRVDYIFAGNDTCQELSLAELVSLPQWAGRRTNLDSLFLEGNGQITMRDEESGRVIYRTSFSSLFQEWQNTEEATQVRKSFENSFLLPYPKRAVKVTLELFNKYRKRTSSLTHRVNPADILIRRMEGKSKVPYRYLWQGGPSDKCIDVAIVAEGYAEADMDTFYRDAQIATEALFGHEPFRKMKDRFNIIAVASPSDDSGVSVPKTGEWRQTALNSHFSTFYSDRYLTTLHLTRLHDLLAGIPYEHIIILANTSTYGGGGIYNSYTLTTTHSDRFRPVVVHEFGHSFGGLADEYYYDDEYSHNYVEGIEPYEQNITTLASFDRKWKDMLPRKTPVPTPQSNKGKGVYTKIGVYEGGGYQSKGVYRAFQECRMKINEAPAFCAVCQRALERLINYYTVESE